MFFWSEEPCAKLVLPVENVQLKPLSFLPSTQDSGPTSQACQKPWLRNKTGPSETVKSGRNLCNLEIDTSF